VPVFGIELKVGPFALLKRVYRESVNAAVSDTAAQLSYYLFFALFPFLFFLASLAAFLPLEDALIEMLARVAQFMPAEAFELVAGHMVGLIETPRPRLLTLGFAAALWTASRGVNAFRKGLNLAYDVKETRPFWHTQLLALGMTLAGAVLVVVALSVIVLGGEAGYFLAEKIGEGRQFLNLWSWLRWPIAAFAIMTVAALNYFLLPDVRQKFKFITPGSVVGTAFWLAATWGFTKYVEYFGKFNVTYGSIGGVVVLLLWLYLSGLVFLLGGELNATVEQVSVGGKEKGARAPGMPAPPKEVRPSIVPPAAAKHQT
jgi:membrane protein